MAVLIRILLGSALLALLAGAASCETFWGDDTDNTGSAASLGDRLA